MQLTPRYGSDPLITLDGPPGAVAEPAVRQLRRFVAELEDLTPEQWAHASRCDGWTARDVVAHVQGAATGRQDGVAHVERAFTFWTFSVTSALAGAPTTFLATFDPVASPREMVAATADLGPDEVLARYRAAVDAFVDVVGSLDGDGWTVQAEAPPGHVPVSVLVHHALWDSWIHERDVLVPLGVEPPVEEDEVAACLRYVAALGPAFDVSRGSGRTGTLAVRATEPDVAFVVEAGADVAVRRGTTEADLVLEGGAVALLEALSIRRPLEAEVPEGTAWLLHGLAEVFEADAV